MKVKDAHIGLQVVCSDAPNATVYQITSLFETHGRVWARLLDMSSLPKRREHEADVGILQLPTLEQLKA